MTAKPRPNDGDLPPDYHLNRIVGVGNRLYVAAEGGQLYRSDDRGASWRALPSPYEGSFFGLVPIRGEGLLAFGLRGHLYRSADAGETWTKLESHTTAMLTDGVAINDLRVIIGGLAGVMLVSGDAGETFRLTQQDDRKGLSGAAARAGRLRHRGGRGRRAHHAPRERGSLMAGSHHIERPDSKVAQALEKLIFGHRLLIVTCSRCSAWCWPWSRCAACTSTPRSRSSCRSSTSTCRPS